MQCDQLPALVSPVELRRRGTRVRGVRVGRWWRQGVVGLAWFQWDWIRRTACRFGTRLDPPATPSVAGHRLTRHRGYPTDRAEVHVLLQVGQVAGAWPPPNACRMLRATTSVALEQRIVVAVAAADGALVIVFSPVWSWA